MPRERLPMRKISDVLRLHAGGLSKRRIAVSLNIGRTAVGDYINRARRAGLGWPLAEDLSDEDLERLLFPPPVAVSPDRRSLPDWPVLHRELKRPGVTLSPLWEEYRAVHRDGYGYSRFATAVSRCWRPCSVCFPFSGNCSPTAPIRGRSFTAPWPASCPISRPRSSSDPIG